MTDYKKLVEALRCGLMGDDECRFKECPYWSELGCKDGIIASDAAAAIDELQAEVDKYKTAWAVERENRLGVEEPNRGEAVEVVRCKECKYGKNQIGGRIKCTYACGGWHEGDWFCADGAKMEVQDG